MGAGVPINQPLGSYWHLLGGAGNRILPPFFFWNPQAMWLRITTSRFTHWGAHSIRSGFLVGG